jgi:hypothetical protein
MKGEKSRFESKTTDEVLEVLEMSLHDLSHAQRWGLGRNGTENRIKEPINSSFSL